MVGRVVGGSTAVGVGGAGAAAGVGAVDGVGAGVDVGAGVEVPAGRVAAPTMSFATDLPAAATPFRTPIALFIRLIVSAIVVADTLPARSRSSTVSAKRWNTLLAGA